MRLNADLILKLEYNQMKKIHILFILSILFVQGLFSQQISSTSPENMQIGVVASKKIVLDTCLFNVQYRVFSVNDVQRLEEKKNYFILLQIGRKMSKFSDYHRLVTDSLEEVHAEQKMSMIESMNRRMPLMKGSTPLNVFKDYPTGKITVTDRVPLSGSYKYVEEKENPLWRLESGSLTVCGYKCNKAATTFHGRSYIAWYTPEIAVSEGPWKFWGLPGLILKVEDDKGHYSFECVAIEKSYQITPIYIPDRSYVNTTKAKLDQALRNFNENPSANVINSGFIQGELPPNAYRARPYNPIELSE